MFINREKSNKYYSDIVKREIIRVQPFLEEMGFVLEKKQPHSNGERRIIGTKKLVLIAKTSDINKRVVIKCSRFREAKKEIKKERRIRNYVVETQGEDNLILFPKEILYKEKYGYVFFATKYIEQEKVFVKFPTKDQLFMILNVIENQNLFHLTTYKHIKNAKKIFNIFSGKKYLKEFNSNIKYIRKNTKNTGLLKKLEEAEELLIKNKKTIDIYCDQLIHDDFVPHNFRVKNRHIYMLDYSAIHFGNKYETLARIINYMTLHNPELAEGITKFIKEKKDPLDKEVLKVMRIYKLIFLIKYHLSMTKETSGNLNKLSKIRVLFWTKVLESILKDTEINKKTLNKYIKIRNLLRSKEEKERQQEFAVA